eukprot:6458667-Amphidinium_carterae.6
MHALIRGTSSNGLMAALVLTAGKQDLAVGSYSWYTCVFSESNIANGPAHVCCEVLIGLLAVLVRGNLDTLPVVDRGKDVRLSGSAYAAFPERPGCVGRSFSRVTVYSYVVVKRGVVSNCCCHSFFPTKLSSARIGYGGWACPVAGTPGDRIFLCASLPVPPCALGVKTQE